MDKRIILLIVVLNLTAIGTFVFKKCYGGKSSVKMNCIINPSSHLISKGDSIHFSDITVGANRWKWDFGDGEYSSSKEGMHTYFDANEYTVRVKVYGDFGSMTDSVKIKVTAPVATYTAPVVVESLISGSDAPAAGHPVNYECKMKAGSYEWAMQGDPDYTRLQTGSLATYTFHSPGVRTLILTTHNPDKTDRKTITVGAGVTAHVDPPKPVQQAKPKHHGQDHGVKPKNVDAEEKE